MSVGQEDFKMSRSFINRQDRCENTDGKNKRQERSAEKGRSYIRSVAQQNVSEWHFGCQIIFTVGSMQSESYEAVSLVMQIWNEYKCARWGVIHSKSDRTVFFDHLVAPVEVKPLSFREKAHR